MIDTAKQGGGAVRSTRILIGIAMAVATCLFLAVGSASAKTVYKYVYSGEFIDGSGSTKGQFRQLAGIDYEPATEKLYVSVPGSPGVIQKFNKNGTPANFSALNNGAGRDYIDLGKQGGGELSVDTSNNPSTKGNIYLGGGVLFGYHPNGLPIEPAFNETQFGEAGKPGRSDLQSCSGTSGPNGEYWDFTQGNGQPEIHLRNLETFKAEKTFLAEGTFGSPFMCNMKVDSQGNFYGIWQHGFFGEQIEAVELPPEPVADTAGGTVAKPPEREQRYRLNVSCCGEPLSFGAGRPSHFGIDRSDDDVFVSETTENFENERISFYDSHGGLLGRFGLAEGSYPGLRSVGGITVDPVTHDVYITNNRDFGGEVRHVDKFVRWPRRSPFPPPTPTNRRSPRPPPKPFFTERSIRMASRPPPVGSNMA